MRKLTRNLASTFVALAALALAFSLTFAACSGDDDNNGPDTPPAPSADVYVAGQEWLASNDSRATLWTNGAAKRLSDVRSTTNSVFVSGDDTYVTGSEYYTDPQGNNRPRGVFWKNGVRQDIQVIDDRVSQFYYSVFVSGDDVYVSGSGGLVIMGGRASALPVIWKNGVAQPLGDKGGRVDSVFVAGSDVYAAGTEDTYNLQSEQSEWRSILWKNGEAQEFDSFASNSIYIGRYSLFVSGSDVYVAGYYGPSDPETNTVRAVLWKNGVRQQLSDNVSNAASVFASGGNAYVAGYEYTSSTSGGGRAILWKDGARQQLSNNPSNAVSVRVLGGDVYVGGSDSISGQGSRAVVWVNGARQQVSNSSSTASSIFVK
jgi:hypothetical protein